MKTKKISVWFFNICLQSDLKGRKKRITSCITHFLSFTVQIRSKTLIRLGILPFCVCASSTLQWIITWQLAFDFHAGWPLLNDNFKAVLRRIVYALPGNFKQPWSAIGKFDGSWTTKIDGHVGRIISLFNIDSFPFLSPSFMRSYRSYSFLCTCMVKRTWSVLASAMKWSTSTKKTCFTELKVHAIVQSTCIFRNSIYYMIRRRYLSFDSMNIINRNKAQGFVIVDCF